MTIRAPWIKASHIGSLASGQLFASIAGSHGASIFLLSFKPRIVRCFWEPSHPIVLDTVPGSGREGGGRQALDLTRDPRESAYGALPPHLLLGPSDHAYLLCSGAPRQLELSTTSRS